MERILQILAAAFLIVAAYFLWRGVTDWSFVCGVLAACSFFVSMRFQIKTRMRKVAIEMEDSGEDQQTAIEPGPETSADNIERTPPNATLHS